MNTISFAADAIGLNIAAAPQPLDLESVVGFALRHNKKRAHLLVSSLLGKHSPQRPDIVDSAARTLAERVHDSLLGQPHDQDLLWSLRRALTRGDAAPQVTRRPDAHVAVVGFAEAAVALGSIVADHLGAYYVSSTRTPQRDAYAHFVEPHSPSADHYLAPEDPAPLDDRTRAIVLVDDELSTGTTVMNTIRALHSRAPHRDYVVATLVDLRDDQAREAMARFADELSVRVEVVSLVSAHVSIPHEAPQRAEEAMSVQIPIHRGPAVGTATTTTQRRYGFAGLTQARDGIADLGVIRRAAERIAAGFEDHGDRVLVLSVEEDTPLAVATSAVLHAQGVNAHIGGTVPTSAAVIDGTGYPLNNGIRIDDLFGSARFIYNIEGRYDHVLIVSSDPTYAREVDAVAVALVGHVQKVTVTTAHRLREPLVGPAFGSYPEADVKWLLKDLSAIELEVPLEVREARVQAGRHYSEALPQEYQPSDEYMSLFWQALEEGAARVADDIAAVAHRIMAARAGRPVLVSLARAGTPVGVLLRRYMQTYFDYTAPHYAVSIIRDRGIDANAMAYIAQHHDPRDVIFVDGWTGKGAITAELRTALIDHAAATGVTFPNDLAVLADTGACTTMYGSRDDYLIPSAALNSTVSGLISRTVLNDEVIHEGDYHGGKFYAELAQADVSLRFVDTIEAHFRSIPESTIPLAEAPTWAARAEVLRLGEKYGIDNINLIKPGVGETTRVLLRRVPWRVLLHPDAGEAVAHIRALAKSRGVPIEEVPGLHFNAVGLIHPKFTARATAEELSAA